MQPTLIFIKNKDNTTKLVSGSRDQTIKIWDAANGKCKRTFILSNPIIWVNYALGDQLFLAVNAGVMGFSSSIFLYNLNNPGLVSSFIFIIPILIILK